jgi:hypothetical protein
MADYIEKTERPARSIRLLRALLWLKSEKHIFQKDIAKMMGVDPNTITRGVKRVESGDGYDFLINFQKAVGYISLDWLLDGTGEMLLTEGEPTEIPRDQKCAVFLKVIDDEIAYHHRRIADLMETRARLTE